MPYFRTPPALNELLSLFDREENWLILINADPDAIASAMALKRIMRGRVRQVKIAKVNEIKRPDNLAMVKYLGIKLIDFKPGMDAAYNRIALVDSQPSHHPLFKDLNFSIVIDHHPLPPLPEKCEADKPADSVAPDKSAQVKPFKLQNSADETVAAPAVAPGRPEFYSEIRPEYGATSTIMTEFLYSFKIRPGKLLATAMQFGIKTDTASFERKYIDVDLRAYQYLARFGDQALLSRITRSEFLRPWLDHFARACNNMYSTGSGQYIFVHDINTPDILVVIADFFMKVLEIRWVAVCGVVDDTVVVVFRGDGIVRDIGAFANQQFGDIGSAGGHKGMARAEFPLEAVNGKDVEMFVWQKLTAKPPKPALPQG